MRRRFLYRALTLDELDIYNKVGYLFQMNEQGILFNNFLFDEINNLQDMILIHGQGSIAFIDLEKGGHTRVADTFVAPIKFPEVNQKMYWVRNSSKVLSIPEIWDIKTAQSKWDNIRNDMQKEWNKNKSHKNIYIHFRRWQLFDFWWTQHYIGKRMRMGYYRGTPHVVSFILKNSEVFKMTKVMVKSPFIERVSDVMKRKRIPMFDKIKQIKGKNNEFYVPPKYVIDPETIIKYY